jgi:methanogenic corrinoid protein MtbC1
MGLGEVDMAEIDKNSELIALIADLQEEPSLSLVRKLIADGMDPLKIIEQCHIGMHQVGERYEQGIYYISGLIMAGEIMQQVSKLVLPLLNTEVSKNDSGKIVLGTVKGDIHFIGKNIFKFMIRCHGFAVHDLGEDVSPNEFLSAAQEFSPDIIGLSCLIDTSYKAMRDTILYLRENLPPEKHTADIIIGGFVDENVSKYVSSNYWTNDAMKGVHLCEKIMKERGDKVLAL